MDFRCGEYEGAGMHHMQERYDSRQCFQLLSDYKQCIFSQNVPFDKINKYFCTNELYSAEKYCPGNVMKNHKGLIKRELIYKKEFSKQELEYMNFKSQYLALLRPADMETFDKLDQSQL